MGAKGVFCVEGLWWSDLRRRSSVQPMLTLLEAQERIPFVHRQCATPEELAFNLGQLSQRRYTRFSIVYLAFHGRPGAIVPSWRRDALVTIEELGEMLAGRCRGRVVMLGACNTAAIRRGDLRRFARTTGALAVCGYAAVVGWMRAAAFELVLFADLQEHEFSADGLDAICTRARRLGRQFSDLKLRVVTAGEA